MEFQFHLIFILRFSLISWPGQQTFSLQTIFFILKQNSPPLHFSIPKFSILFQSQLSTERNAIVSQAV